MIAKENGRTNWRQSAAKFNTSALKCNTLFQKHVGFLRVFQINLYETRQRDKPMNDRISNFRYAMEKAGFTPPENIRPGAFMRFPGQGKGRGNTAGFCKLFEDCRAGVFGDFSSGFQMTWKSRDHTSRHSRQRSSRTRPSLNHEWPIKSEPNGLNRKAWSIWKNSLPAVNHPYVERKGVGAHGSRLDDYSRLVVPVTDGYKLISLQFIYPDGTKRFLAGGRVAAGFFRIGKRSDCSNCSNAPLLICEGFATGATLYERTGIRTYAAFNAGNLIRVARILRQHFCEAEMGSTLISRTHSLRLIMSTEVCHVKTQKIQFGVQTRGC